MSKQNIFKKRIEKITTSWYEVHNGAIEIETGKDGFIENGVLMHKLNFEEFTDAIVVLTNAMMMPNQGVFIRDEHYDMWNWGANLITVFCPEKQPPVEVDMEKRLMLETFIRSFQNFHHFIPRNQEEANISKLLSNSRVIAANMAFPMLERVLKEKCSDIVDLNGQVIKDFDVNKFNGIVNKYSKDRQKRKFTISSIEDLMSYYLENKVSPEIKLKLEEIFDQIFKTFMHPYKKIYHGVEIIQSLRNSTLHGNPNLGTVAGVIFSIILLIELDSLAHEFDFIKDNALSNYKHYGKMKDKKYYHISHEEYYRYMDEWIND